VTIRDLDTGATYPVYRTQGMDGLGFDPITLATIGVGALAPVISTWLGSSANKDLAKQQLQQMVQQGKIAQQQATAGLLMAEEQQKLEQEKTKRTLYWVGGGGAVLLGGLLLWMYLKRK